MEHISSALPKNIKDLAAHTDLWVKFQNQNRKKIIDSSPLIPCFCHDGKFWIDADGRHGGLVEPYGDGLDVL